MGLIVTPEGEEPSPELRAAYARGFYAAAGWAKREDLYADIGSPAYVEEMKRLLSTGRPPVIEKMNLPITLEGEEPKQLFEIHLTMSTKHATVAELLAKALHWKTSEIARDPVLGKDSFFYLTTYADSKEAAMEKIASASSRLKAHGIPLLREKIEHIVHDVRY